MKKTTLLLMALIGLIGSFTGGSAMAVGSDEVTLIGEGKCAKCALHETDKCQNALLVKEGGKTVTYYLAPNQMSKAFHENLCQETKKITVTGTVKEADGKKTMTVTKIELVK
jgi:hypothetical protein